LSVLSFSLNTLGDAGAYAILSSLYQTKYPMLENESDLEGALATVSSSDPPTQVQIKHNKSPSKELTYYGFPKTQRRANEKGSLTQLFMAAVEMTNALSGLIRDVILTTRSLIALDVRNNHFGKVRVKGTGIVVVGKGKTKVTPSFKLSKGTSELLTTARHINYICTYIVLYLTCLT